jgi:hypothetical protein
MHPLALGSLHPAELELSAVRATVAELEPSAERTTGPSWTRRRWLPSWRAPHRGRAGAVRRARHRGRAGAVRRARHRGRVGAVRRGATGAELELSAERTTGAELDAATMAAVLARAHGAELELSDARAPGPSWSCPTRAPRGRAGRGDDGCRPGARHRPELELSDARALRRAPPWPSGRARHMLHSAPPVPGLRRASQWAFGGKQAR